MNRSGWTRRRFLGVALGSGLLTLSGFHRSAAAAAGMRLVSVGGGVTETIFALGAGEHVVGVDTTSTEPAAAARRPQVGFLHALSAEGIVSLRPDAVVHEGGAGPEQVLSRLSRFGIENWVLDSEPSRQGLAARIEALSERLSLAGEGERLLARIDADLGSARDVQDSWRRPPPRVAFLMAHGGADAVAAGHGNKAQALIDLAGAVNVFTEFSGYRPVSREALLAARPDALIATGAAAAYAAPPGVPALFADTLFLLGFGPRMGQAVLHVTRFLDDPERVIGVASLEARNGEAGRSAATLPEVRFG